MEILDEGKHRKFRPGNGGGRANTGGVLFEVEVAAWFAVSVLAGNGRDLPWALPAATFPLEIYCQAGTCVDDLVVPTNRGGRIFVQAKKGLSMGDRGARFAGALQQLVRQYLDCQRGSGAGLRRGPLNPDRDRLVLIVDPLSANVVREVLPSLLNQLRQSAPSQHANLPLSNRAQKANNQFFELMRAAWLQECGTAPSEEHLGRFLKMFFVHVLDIGCNGRDREAANSLLRSVLVEPGGSAIAWSTLISHFLVQGSLSAACNRASLIDKLSRDGISVQPDISHGQRRVVSLPHLPAHYVHRGAYSEHVRDALLSPPGANGRPQPVCLFGMPGVGKSALAAAVARDQAVRDRYPDGICWLPVGRNVRNMTQLPEQLIEWLTGAPPPRLPSWRQAGTQIAQLTQGLSCLIILDDVWNAEHLKAFKDIGDRSNLLITTRNHHVGEKVLARHVAIEPMEQEEACRLLATASERLEGKEARIVALVAKRCGHLPLMLAVIGRSAKRRDRNWRSVLDWLDQAPIGDFRISLPDYEYDDVASALRASVDDLKEENQWVKAAFLRCAIFPSNVPIPLTTLALLWKPISTGYISAQGLADLLTDISLLMPYKGDGRYLIHDIYGEYLKSTVPNQHIIHAELVEAYRSACGADWAAGPLDQYCYDYLFHHLMAAGLQRESQDLLFNSKWLHNSEYEAANWSDSERWTSARVHKHSDWVIGLRFLPDGRHAVSASKDGHVRILDVMEPSNCAVLGTHDAAVWSAVPSHCGRWISSGCGNGNVRIWEIGENWSATGQPKSKNADNEIILTTTPVGSGPDVVYGGSGGLLHLWHTTTERRPPLSRNAGTPSDIPDWIWNLKVTPDGGTVATGSSTGEIILWTLPRLARLDYLVGHENSVWAIDINADGTRLLSGSADHTVILWDLVNRVEILRIPGHQGWPWSVAFVPGTNLIVTGSTDRTVRLWDLTDNRLLKVYESVCGFTTLSVDSHGKRLIAGDNEGFIHVLDI